MSYIFFLLSTESNMSAKSLHLRQLSRVGFRGHCGNWKHSTYHLHGIRYYSAPIHQTHPWLSVPAQSLGVSWESPQRRAVRWCWAQAQKFAHNSSFNSLQGEFSPMGLQSVGRVFNLPSLWASRCDAFCQHLGDFHTCWAAGRRKKKTHKRSYNLSS